MDRTVKKVKLFFYFSKHKNKFFLNLFFRYFEIGNIKRKINKQKNSSITNQILEYIKKLINKNPTVKTK